MKIRTITICSSASHYGKVIEIEKELKKLGFKVKIPKTANRMKRDKNFNPVNYKTWLKDKNDYVIKKRLMVGHFNKILKSDAILVTNFEKNGIEGYIGGNVLIEIAIAFHHNKPVFIYNEFSENLPYKEEILSVFPKILNGDLRGIK